MKLSEIADLLNQILPAEEFEILAHQETSEYRKLLEANKSSIPIYLDDDCSFNFAPKHLSVLCALYLKDKITQFELGYISDCLTMAESVTTETEDLYETLIFLSELDPRIKPDNNWIQQLVDKIN
jgi:hypothetical protein